MGAAEDKAALRRRLREETAAFPAEYIADSDAAITKELLSSELWNRARRIFVYHSIGREPDTTLIIKAALASGKTAALPKCGKNGVMTAFIINSLEELVPGVFGIPEPTGGEIMGPESTDTAIIPAVAFDRAGFRLGQGGGYYDRWLAGFSGISVGLCRDRLLQDRVPRESHDMSVGFIATGAGLLRVK